MAIIAPPDAINGISGNSTTTDTDLNLDTDHTTIINHIVVPSLQPFSQTPTFYFIDFKSIFGDDNDSHILGFTGGVNPAPVSGILKVDVEINPEIGLMLSNPKHVSLSVRTNISPPVFNTIYPFHYENFPCPTSYGTTPLLDALGNPIVINIQGVHVNLFAPCTPTGSCTTNVYTLYFRISDFVATGMLPQDLPTLFSQGKLIFGLNGCCTPANSPTPYKVNISILPNESCFNLSSGSCAPSPQNPEADCCWIPLSEDGGEIFIHCPGCVAPGTIVDYYRMFRTTLGFPDSDDNGVVDNTTALTYFPGQSVTSPQNTYWPDYSELQLYKSAYGDELEDYMVGHFDPGSDVTGYSYGFMQSHQINLDVLQLYREFTLSGSADFDVQVTGFDFYIDGTVQGTPVDHEKFEVLQVKETLLHLYVDFSMASQATIDALFTRNTGDSRMLFTFDEGVLADLYDQQTPPNSDYSITLYNSWTVFGDIDYQDFQQYRLRVRYKVCGNKQSQNWNENSSNMNFESTVTDFLWLRGTAQDLSNISGVGDITAFQMPFDMATMNAAPYNPPNAYNMYFPQTPGSSCLNPPTPTCTEANQVNLGNSYYFYCEPGGGSHTFLSTDMLNDTRYNRFDDPLHDDCKAVITISAINSFGRIFTPNYHFKKEFRVPKLFPSEFTVDLPNSDWTWLTQNGNLVMDVGSYNCYGGLCTRTSPPLTINNGALPAIGSPYVFSLNSLTTAPNTPLSFNCLSNSAILQPDLFIGDEQSFQRVNIFLKPVDCSFQTPPPLTPPSASAIEFSPIQQACSTYISCAMPPATVDNYFPDYLLKINPPNPNLTFYIAPAVFNANSGTVSWQFYLRNFVSPGNMNPTSAKNVYIGFENNVPSPYSFLTGWNVTYDHFDANNNIVASNSTGLQNGYYLWLTPASANQNELRKNEYYSGTITAQLTDCSLLPENINFVWGWNCEKISAPPDVTAANLCQTAQNTVLLDHIPGDLQIEAFEYTPPSYTACSSNPVTVKACFKNQQAVYVQPQSFSIDIPPGSIITFPTGMIPQLTSCNTGNMPPYTQVSALPPPNTWEIIHNGMYMMQNDCFCVQFEILTDDCEIGELQMPVVSVEGVDICNQPIMPCSYQLPHIGAYSPSECEYCYEIYKTAIPGTVYVGDQTNPVTYTITVTANNATSSTVLLDDQFPANFAQTSSVVFPITGFGVPATGQTSISVTGIFTDDGPCQDNINVATIEFGNPTTTLSAEACVEVICPTGIPIDGPITTHDYFSIPPGSAFTVPQGTYSLSGELIIDNLIIFDNCTLIVAPSGFITVNSQMTLTFQNFSLLYGCPNMWQGIVMNQHSTVNLFRSTLRDADRGLDVSDNCTFTSIASGFLDCVVGIFVPENLTGQFNNIAGMVTGTTFGRVLPHLKSGYSNQPQFGLYGRAGMLLNDVGMMTIGDNQQAPNEFFNLNFGIELHNSNADVTNTEFHDIVEDGAYAQYGVLKPYGCAISARVSRDWMLYLNVFPLAASGVNTIDKAPFGIYTNRYNARIANVPMDHVETGVRSEQSANCTVQVTGCTIHATYRGIDWRDNDWANQMLADGNAIVVEPVGPGYTKGAACISLAEYTATAQANYQIMYNNPLTTVSAGAGLLANTINNGFFEQNQIFTTEVLLPAPGTAGIALTGGSRCTLLCNTVENSIPLSNLGTSGLFVSQSTGNDIICNNLYYSAKGIKFSGADCMNTVMKGNKMDNNDIGLYLDISAVISQQPVVPTPPDPYPPYHGNKWTGIFNSFGAVNMNAATVPDLFINLFTILDPASSGLWDQLPSVPNGIFPWPNNSGWFILQQSGNTFECSPQNGVPVCGGALAIGGEESMGEDLRMSIVQDSSVTVEYIPESKSLAKQFVYDELSHDSVLLASNTVYQSFRNTHTNSTLGKLFDVQELLKHRGVVSEPNQQLLSDADSLMRNYLDQICALDSLDAIDSTLNFSAQRQSLVSAINMQQLTVATILTQLSVADSLVIQNALLLNSQVPGGELPQVNEKYINGKALSYFTGGEQVIASDFSQLHQVAMQCPAAGGPAVFTARALLEIVTDSIVYDDENVCLQSGYFRKVNETKPGQIQDLVVVPNPASETVEIRLRNATEGMCKIRIITSLGNPVYLHDFNCADKMLEVDVSKIPPGMYFVEVLLPESFYNSTKLVIVR